MKDMTGDDQFIRASAIRSICAITDASMLPGIERYVKQAIVDRNNGIATAALVSSLRFNSVNPDFIKRWLNEIGEICKNDSYISQYHAFGLMYMIKQHERLALVKLVAKYSHTSFKIIPCAILCIRIAVHNLSESIDAAEAKVQLDFIENCLNHRSEIVVYEACRALACIKGVPIKYLSQVVGVMRVFLGSPKIVVRFSAVSTLCYMSSKHPDLISECSLDLEALLSDSNKSLATFAVTTLLKIGSDSNIDRIISLISSFLSEITESFRIIIVKELKYLALKYPAKSRLFLNFITTMLREEGGLEYKAGLVDFVTTIIHESTELKEEGLLLLCEFIEDCEHAQLLKSVMCILGKEGPTSKNPSQYIRYIYNRIMLESCQIRAAAVVCLAQFALNVPALKSSVLVLIRRCFFDSDDEVRDRACYYYTLLKDDADPKFICGGRSVVLLTSATNINPEAWLKALDSYIQSNDGSHPFTVSAVAEFEKISPPEPDSTSSVGPLILSQDESEKASPFSTLEYLLEKMTILASDSFSHISKPQHLTDSDAEFDIICIKHVFSKNIVFEYIVRNTLNDKIMLNVKLHLSLPNEFKLIKAADIIVNLIGLSVHNQTDQIDPKSKYHRILLSGKYRTDCLVLAKVDLKIDRGPGILLKMTI
ncbi:hypothetical protein MXB_5527, partial [Myxobolus squamalis]